MNDKSVFGTVSAVIAIVWVLAMCLSLGLTGAIIWAIVKVVNHFT